MIGAWYLPERERTMLVLRYVDDMTVAQAADEMAGLRAELMALRSQLEIMLGTDLGVRPALP